MNEKGVVLTGQGHLQVSAKVKRDQEGHPSETVTNLNVKGQIP